MRVLVIRTLPDVRLLVVASCQPAPAVFATRPIGMATIDASRARAVNRLALPATFRPRAIVGHRRTSALTYGVLAPVAVSATVNVAPWQKSFAALLIEIAFAMSTFRLPFTPPLAAGTSQPEPPLSCGDVTLTLPVLQPLWPASTEIAPSAIELT